MVYQNKPFIIKNSISGWPALNEHPWNNLDYLKKVVGAYRTVPIEIGKNYTENEWTQKLINFSILSFSEETPLTLTNWTYFKRLHLTKEVKSYSHPPQFRL